MAEFKCKDITEKIIAASFKVHKFLDNGFPSAAKGLTTARQEVIYQRVLAQELKQSALNFERKIEQDIFYKELPERIGTRRADFVVEGKVFDGIKSSQ